MCNVPGRAHKRAAARGSRRHVWAVIIAAAILLSIAGIVLFLHDLSEARSRKAFDRIFEEGSRRRR
jgi:hypothetical protein